MSEGKKPVALVVTLFVLCWLPLAVLIAWFSGTAYPGYFCGGYSTPFSFGNTTCDQWQSMNYHPTLMMTSFGALFSTAAISFKALPFSHLANKVVHLTCQTIALACSSLAIWVAYQYHEVTLIPHMYSPHSWIGALAYGFFVLQWIGITRAFTATPCDAMRTRITGKAA
jgi:hypothetical protein